MSAPASALPSDYAARRRELLAEAHSPGAGIAMRRKGLAALTDSWLRQVFADAVAATRGVARRGPPWWRSAATAAASWPRAATSTCCCCTPTASVGRCPGRQDLVPGLGRRRAPRPRGAHLRARPGGWRARTSPCCSACSTPARSPATRRWSAGCARSVLGDWRAAARRRLPELREAWDERGARHRGPAPRPRARPQGGPRRAARRRVAAGGGRLLGGRPAAPRRRRRRTPAGRRTRRPAPGHRPRRATACCCRSRTRWPTDLGLADADALLREVGASAAAVTHAADVTWRRALQATRPQRSRFVRGRKPVLRLLGPGLAEHDGEAVLTAQADPRSDPLLVLRMAARAARVRPAALAQLGRPAGRRQPGAARALAGERPPAVRRAARGRAAAGAGVGGPRPGRADRPACCRSGTWCGTARSATRCTGSASTGTCSRRPCGPPTLVREVHRPGPAARRRACCTTSARARPGDHSEAGPAARRSRSRSGWASTPTTSRTVGLLVRHHLLLVETATRRDLRRPGDRRCGRGRRWAPPRCSSCWRP